jgi:hypothetical protein
LQLTLLARIIEQHVRYSFEGLGMLGVMGLLTSRSGLAGLLICSLCSASAQSIPASHSIGATAEAFRNSVDTPPAGWNGPLFKLSHAYPKQQPTCDAPWLKRQVSFSEVDPKWDDWRGYVQDIVDYIKRSQNPNLPDVTGWQTTVSGQTLWYHVPWMAFDGQRGREFAHGLTNELSTALSTFHEGRGSGKEHIFHALVDPGTHVDPLFETWSVGMYNACGAWSLGQVFPHSGIPTVRSENGQTSANGLPFPNGTVVIKLLNTTADAASVPYLRGTTDWQADCHVQFAPDKYSTCDRRVRKVHLIQIDLAVVDERSPTRWVYSTLTYNGNLPGKSVLDRMEALGVQWGTDPHTFPATTRAESKPLQETVLAPVSLPEHYGCERRLAGAVDQANSSCVSCHMGAFAAPPPYLNIQSVTVPAIFSFPGMCTTYNADNAGYFSNYRYPQTYPTAQSPSPFAGAVPLDSSLQLAVAFAQYATYISPRAFPLACPDPRM